MRDVAGVFPRLHVIEKTRGLLRSAFGEDVGRFMRHPHEAGTRGIRLRPDDVADRSETGLRPGVNEGIQFRVAVESDAEGIRFEDAVKLGLDADNGARLVVVGERPARSISVATEIGRIGDYGIDRRAGKPRQHGQAIALNDLRDKRFGVMRGS